MLTGEAVWQGIEYRDVVAVRHDWVIDDTSHWFLAATFEGERVAIAFRTSEPAHGVGGAWPGIAPDVWRSSLDAEHYRATVDTTRERIAAGDVYQANICRVLRADLPVGARMRDLWRAVDAEHASPYSGYIDVAPCDALPDGLGIVSASPERFLLRNGERIRTSPIKGTARTADALLDKDRAENLMIVDLMRNDCSHICLPGTVAVADLFSVEQHPGLVQLVSHIDGTLRPDVGWEELAHALLPAGSVSGAPKMSALRIIRELEGRDRGHYCGVFGMARGDTGDLAVGIRSFFRVRGGLEFGTGAGITWGSDPHAEWDETDLKAARLIAICGRDWSAA